MSRRKYTLLVGWNHVAADIVECNGPKTAIRTLERRLGREGDVDYDILEFSTPEERNAYIRGVNDGNGWDNPAWWFINPKKRKNEKGKSNTKKISSDH